MAGWIGSNRPPWPCVAEEVSIEDGQMDYYYNHSNNKHNPYQRQLSWLAINFNRPSNSSFFCLFFFSFILSVCSRLLTHHFLSPGLSVNHWSYSSSPAPLCPCETLYQIQLSNFVATGAEAISEQWITGKNLQLVLPLKWASVYQFIIFMYWKHQIQFS